MFPSVILYSGLLATLLGGGATLRRKTRRNGAIIGAGGIVLAAIALTWPVREKRAMPAVTRLDAAMPRWQFDERHEIHIDAPPDAVFAAIRAVTADEIFLFRTLTAIRRFGRPGPESIINAPEKQPILDVATRSTFTMLADEPPRELVVGSRIDHEGRIYAAMNFLVTADPTGGSIVSTETRVNASTDAARRTFTVYWRVIQPGSDLIRRGWLRAIKKRAENATRM